MIDSRISAHAQRLIAERTPFVVATVVRARRPTSVRPGDAAIVLPDGTIEGFVGGVCAESSVRLHSLKAIETGEPLLLRLVPGDPGAELDADQPSAAPAGDDAADMSTSDALDGAVVEHNPCLSGGALEIFLEPHVPAPRVLVIGRSPIAEAIEQLCAVSGYDCVRTDGGAGVDATGAAAVIVASHGNAEEAILAAALNAGVAYVALVASPRRGTAVRAELEIPDELRAQLHTPAGLDIGARTPAEIAISVLAQIIAERHTDPAPTRPGVASVPQEVTLAVAQVAIDPVCGMKVAVSPSSVSLVDGGRTLYFCCEGCRERYAREHNLAVR